MIEDRVISPELTYEDESYDESVNENTLRPKVFSEYVGQEKVKENLKNLPYIF